MSDATDRRDPVDILAEEFAARLRAGETPSLDEYVRRCPAHAASIRAVFPSIALVERVSNQEFTERRTTHPFGDRPKTLGDFRVIREVGRGGMGVVYEAVQTSLNRRVALKLLGPHVSGSATQLQRFRREAEAVARLHHTNIVPIYGVGEEEGLHFYAMQFIEGASLAAVIQSVARLCRPRKPGASPGASSTVLDMPSTLRDPRAAVVYHPDAAARSLLRGHGSCDGTVTPPAATDPAPMATATATEAIDVPDDMPGTVARYWRGVARLVAEIADALSYAHRHGVLHRDIKPSNLLLDRDGGIWITDFGLAKQEDQEGLTDAGDIIGTLRYMAPEQLDGHTDARSDVYSLGLTLFELLTLRPAYDGSGHGLLIKSKTREAPSPPRSLDPRIPADLETITLKCCATDPGHRYRTAQELAEDLRRFLEDRPIRARRVRAPERLWRWCRRNPVVAGLSSATFLLLLTVAIVFAVGHYRTRQALASLEREHTRAETNLALAIRAFERIIGNISSRGIAQPPVLELGGTVSMGPETVLTAADAELLKTLLAFFDRLANQNGTDLKVESASARKRVGDIQQRLGRFVEAEARYREALDAYTALSKQDPDAGEWIVARACILNDMGVTAGRRGAFRESSDHHVAARKLIEGSPRALESKAGRLELAHTMMLFCSIWSRNGVESLFESLRPGFPTGSGPSPAPGDFGSNPVPGPGPSPGWRGPRDGSPFPGGLRNERKEAINRAIVLVRGLLIEEPRNPEYRLFLARAYREQVRIVRVGRDRDRELAEQSLRTAIELLDRLVSDFPTQPEYQSALAEMLCTPLELPGDPKPDPETHRRIQRAVALSEQLLAAHPHIPEHRILSGSVLNRLAWLQQASGHPVQARETYLQAIALQASLSREFPSVLHNAIALAESLQQLADVEVVLGRSEEAGGHLASAIACLERFPKGNAARFLPPLIRGLRERRAAIE